MEAITHIPLAGGEMKLPEMNFQSLYIWLAGNDDLSDIHRIYNITCFTGALFCILAGVECVFASLSPILIANNFFYGLILAVLFYLSRFRKKFGVSRFLSIFVLLFIYTPILWIYNGGSVSGIPYYILMFSSFMTVSNVAAVGVEKKKLSSGVLLIIFNVIMLGLILLEFLRPHIFYQYETQPVRYIDMAISMVFALTSNYFILRAFIVLYYKQLNKAREYSQQLEELVTRDSMTGLYHHGFIIESLTREIEKASRYHRPLSILMLDIDHFKRINDTCGHPFGDEVLVKVARAIQLSCRSVDIVARYGGEEFLMVLPETTASSAKVIAARLQEIIRNIPFGHSVTVTLSGGIVGYQPGDTTAAMIERVDHLLYVAKNEGRNRIIPDEDAGQAVPVNDWNSLE